MISSFEKFHMPRLVYVSFLTVP